MSRRTRSRLPLVVGSQDEKLAQIWIRTKYEMLIVKSLASQNVSEYLPMTILCLLVLVVGIAEGQVASDDDWARGNLVSNGDFAQGTVGGLPVGWDAVNPNPAVAP